MRSLTLAQLEHRNPTTLSGSSGERERGDRGDVETAIRKNSLAPEQTFYDRGRRLFFFSYQRRGASGTELLLDGRGEFKYSSDTPVALWIPQRCCTRNSRLVTNNFEPAIMDAPGRRRGVKTWTSNKRQLTRFTGRAWDSKTGSGLTGEHLRPMLGSIPKG